MQGAVVGYNICALSSLYHILILQGDSFIYNTIRASNIKQMLTVNNSEVLTLIFLIKEQLTVNQSNKSSIKLNRIVLYKHLMRFCLKFKFILYNRLPHLVYHPISPVYYLRITCVLCTQYCRITYVIHTYQSPLSSYCIPLPHVFIPLDFYRFTIKSLMQFLAL